MEERGGGRRSVDIRTSRRIRLRDGFVGLEIGESFRRYIRAMKGRREEREREEGEEGLNRPAR